MCVLYIGHANIERIVRWSSAELGNKYMWIRAKRGGKKKKGMIIISEYKLMRRRIMNYVVWQMTGLRSPLTGGRQPKVRVPRCRTKRAM